MIKVTCIQKVRDPQGKIISYVLEDCHGNQKVVEPLDLKASIINSDIAVSNLKLTSDGRLIDSKPDDMNTRDDILGINDDYNAGIFVKNVAEHLKSFGIEATLQKLDTHSKLGIRTCVIIRFNNGKLIGISGNELETNNKIQEILANTGMRKFGMTVSLTVKTAQKDGNNKLLDYNIMFGAVKDAKDNNEYFGNDYLATGGGFNQNMKNLLNYKMDAFETSTYLVNYSEDKRGKHIDYRDSEGDINKAALYFVQQFVKILGIPETQLPKSIRIGLTIGNMASNLLGNAIVNQTAKTVSSNGYNEEIVSTHKRQMELNEDIALDAASELGVNNLQTLKDQHQQEAIKNLKNSKGLFGMMKAFDRK